MQFGIVIIVILLVMTFSQVVILAGAQKRRHAELMDLLKSKAVKKPE